MLDLIKFLDNDAKTKLYGGGKARQRNLDKMEISVSRY